MTALKSHEAGRDHRDAGRSGAVNDDLGEALAALHPLIHALELRITDIGVPIALSYLASARGSLRHVAACLTHHASRPCGGEQPIIGEVVPGSDIVLKPEPHRPGVATRARVSPRGARKAPGAEMPRWAAVPDLGAALITSPAAAAMCSGPVGSTLLFCALAHHRWMHLATGAKWSTDLAGAAALVKAMNDGSGCSIIVSGIAACAIDREVLEVLSDLGWARITSPAMPGSPI